MMNSLKGGNVLEQGSHTPFWEWGPWIWEISGALIKIGKIYLVFIHDVSIARLISIDSKPYLVFLIYNISFNN